jgi:hypothetical protein
MLGEEPVRVGGLQSLIDLIAYEAELIHLIATVEPLPTAASCGHYLVVTVLPRAQCLRWHAEHPGDCSDAVNAIGSVRAALHSRDLPVLSLAYNVRDVHSTLS